MSTSDVESTVKDYANATRNAMKAGFDGVEIHGMKPSPALLSAADFRRCKRISYRPILPGRLQPTF